MKICLRMLMLFLLVPLLSGCFAHTVDVGFDTAQKLNSDSDWSSLPVEVKVYQLKDDQIFNSATFNDLWKQGRQTLGSSFVGVKNYTLLPGRHDSFTFESGPNTKYIGFVAIFLRHEHGTWRSAQAVPHVYLWNPHFKVTLSDNQLHAEQAWF